MSTTETPTDVSTYIGNYELILKLREHIKSLPHLIRTRKTAYKNCQRSGKYISLEHLPTGDYARVVYQAYAILRGKEITFDVPKKDCTIYASSYSNEFSKLFIPVGKVSAWNVIKKDKPLDLTMAKTFIVNFAEKKAKPDA